VSAQPTGALPPSMSRSAAVSGVLFALLHGAALVLVRLSVPGATTERRDWLARDASTLAPTLHLLAYAAAKGPLDRGLHRVYKMLGPARWRALGNIGAGEKSRTPDLRITNALLYQLSYTGAGKTRIVAARRGHNGRGTASCRRAL
jgi:hypothetical protein